MEKQNALRLPRSHSYPHGFKVGVATQTDITLRKSFFSCKRTLNTLLVVLVLVCLSALYRDIQRRVETAAREASIEIQRCAEKYTVNKCSPHERIPIAQEFCKELEKCMTKDPYDMAMSFSILALYLAEVLNNLIEPLSFKALSFALVLFGGTVVTLSSSLKLIQKARTNLIKY